MKIEEITLRNFRNYAELRLRPSAGINLFFGLNGSGKTNLLEAIHYCALGKSHRVASDASVIRAGETFAYCETAVRTGGVLRNISVQISAVDQNKKTIQIDHKKIRRFSEMMGCLQCVIFSPEDLGLIREGPSLRRRYLDMMISQINQKYFLSLQQYKAAMEQRNAILKNLRGDSAGAAYMLEDFERLMARQAAVIVEERKKIIEMLSDLTCQTYRQISGRESERFTLGYHSSLKEESSVETALFEALQRSREDDIRQGITTIGPHRDDLTLALNKKNMKLFASQGQVRTAALSLKLAQMKTLKSISGEDPVLLLDDVMSELDKDRRSRLLEEIGSYQTFITCTDQSDLEEITEYRIYQVQNLEGLGQVTGENGMEEEKPVILAEPDFL